MILADLLRVVTQPMKIYLIIPNEAPYWFENGPYIDYSAEYEFLKKMMKYKVTGTYIIDNRTMNIYIKEDE